MGWGKGGHLLLVWAGGMRVASAGGGGACACRSRRRHASVSSTEQRNLVMKCGELLWCASSLWDICSERLAPRCVTSTSRRYCCSKTPEGFGLWHLSKGHEGSIRKKRCLPCLGVTYIWYNFFEAGIIVETLKSKLLLSFSLAVSAVRAPRCMYERVVLA